MTGHDETETTPATRRYLDPDDPTAFPLRDHLGIHIDHPEPGRATATATVTAAMYNPHGLVHGGVPFTMVDTIMGTATKSLLGDAHTCATIEISMRFLRPVAKGTLQAEAHVVHLGDTIAQVAATVHDDQGRQVAAASASFAIINLEQEDDTDNPGPAPTGLPETGSAS